ncbi:MAG: ComF family protein [Armatimonadetes bacterium]|nr:ComF family protein [Armatimonadota bacterium]
MNAKTFLARLGHGLLDLVYPPMCLVCGDRLDTGTLCDDCVASFEPVAAPFCTVCGRGQEGDTCRNCERFLTETGAAFAFDAARAGAVYGGAIRHAIHLLKYREKESLALPLGAFLANRLTVGKLLPEPVAQVVAYVPMHPKRERGRGYNQARLIAEPVAEILGVPLLDNAAFVRTRHTAPQMGSSDRARRGNFVGETFAVADETAVRGKDVLLVDDVYTTGATANACAACLKAGGAATVRMVCLAAASG